MPEEPKVVPEFKDVSTDDIAEKYIEGTPHVANVPVDPGLTNAYLSQIKGDRNEDGVPNEGFITYDILFHARAPGTGAPITLIINIEAQRTQKDTKLGYHLMKRAIFYVSRLISSQKEREFAGKDHNKIKKVYSIWICMDSPDENSYINHYRMEEKHLLHRYEEDRENYDLPNIVVISLGEKADKDKLIHLLQVLFTESQRTYESKKEVLEQEYGMKLTPDMKEEMITMCNISLNITEKAFNEGMDKKSNEIAIRMLSNGFSVESTAGMTDLTLEAVKEIKKDLEEKEKKAGS